MKKEKRPKEEIGAELDKLGIEWAFHGDWVWAFGIGPNPHRKCDCAMCKEMSSKRDALTELGFRFKKSGDHYNDDPTDPYFPHWGGRGSRWSHSCERPTRYSKKPKGEDNPKPKENETKTVDEKMEALAW